MNTDQTLLPQWDTQNDELEQVQFTSEKQIILKGSELTTFEFGASMRLRQTEEKGQPEFGILLQYTAQERLQIQFIMVNGSWKLAVTSEGIAPVIDHVLTLPASFKAERWHALSVAQMEEQIQIFLDEAYILGISETARAAQPGLLTQNAAVDYAGIWHKCQR